MDEYCEKILNLLRDHPRGLVNREIAEKTDMSVPTVAKKLDLLEALNKIERERVGAACKNYLK